MLARAAPRRWSRAVEVLRVGALVLDERARGASSVSRSMWMTRVIGVVEQVEVVAHHEQRAAVRAQELEEPVAGVGVEVVGGLVEQQQLAAGEQDAHELEPPALAARQRTERSGRGGRRASPTPAASRRTSDSAA